MERGLTRQLLRRVCAAEVDTQDASYNRHQAEEQYLLEVEALPTFVTQPGTIDAQRHERMYDLLLPLIEAHPDARWLTIGDGRFGGDAMALKKRGARAVASSIADVTLAEAKNRGLIDEFAVVNAENIPFENDAFDFVLCKESYHHFPRPPVAFYEMLRVASRAVILIEPQETRPRLMDGFKSWFKRTFRAGQITDLFEPSGNYIYRASFREVEKMLLAMNQRSLAVRRFNDFAHAALADEPYDSLSPKVALFRIGIFAQDVLGGLGLMQDGLASIVAFKGEPDLQTRRCLRKAGYMITDLPVNPFLDTEN